MQDRITTKERGPAAAVSPSVMDRLTGLAKAKAGELLGQEGLRQPAVTPESPDAPRLDGDDLHQERARSKT